MSLRHALHYVIQMRRMHFVVEDGMRVGYAYFVTCTGVPSSVYMSTVSLPDQHPILAASSNNNRYPSLYVHLLPFSLCHTQCSAKACSSAMQFSNALQLHDQ